MAAPIEINLNTDDLVAAFAGFEVQAEDLSNVLTKIGRRQQAEYRKIFQTQGGRGRRWAPLKASSIRDRIRKGFSGTVPLDRSGQLRRSFVGESEGTIFEVEPDRVKVGSDNETANFHDLGTKFMPQRQIVIEDLELFNEYAEELARALDKAFG